MSGSRDKVARRARCRFGLLAHELSHPDPGFRVAPRSRDHRRLPLIIVAVMFSARVQARDVETSFAVGRGSWTLEQFGDDVAVLRSPSGTSQSDASLLMGCDGRDRSLRLTLPEPLQRGSEGSRESGAILITPETPPPAHTGLVTTFRVAGGSSLVMAAVSGTAHDPVRQLLQLLIDKPRRLDILVSWGSGPVILTRLDSARLRLPDDAPDRRLADQFAAACDRSDVR